MPLLNAADAIMLGETPVTAVYAGDVEVWPGVLWRASMTHFRTSSIGINYPTESNSHRIHTGVDSDQIRTWITPTDRITGEPVPIEALDTRLAKIRLTRESNGAVWESPTAIWRSWPSNGWMIRTVDLTPNWATGQYIDVIFETIPNDNDFVHSMLLTAERGTSPSSQAFGYETAGSYNYFRVVGAHSASSSREDLEGNNIHDWLGQSIVGKKFAVIEEGGPIVVGAMVCTKYQDGDGYFPATITFEENYWSSQIIEGKNYRIGYVEWT